MSSILTDGPLCSFINHDMLMRHFSYGIGHLQYQRQQEIGSNPEMVAEGDKNYDVTEMEEAKDATEHRGDPGVNKDDIIDDAEGPKC